MRLILVFVVLCLFAAGSIFMLSMMRNGQQMAPRGAVEISESDRNVLAGHLFQQVRILCFVQTVPNFRERAEAVNKTWGARCNKMIFVSSKQMAGLPVLLVDIEEKRENLWQKTIAALLHCHDHELEKFDFFLKADDDTYVIMENLRAFLQHVPPSKPIAFGRKFKYRNDTNKVYFSGGAGYVLSRGGLRRLFEAMGKPLKRRCPYSGSEDFSFGLCATAAGIQLGDSRDRLGRQRFQIVDPIASELQLHYAPWLNRYDFYPTREGKECCSNFAISYHYIKPDMMKIMDIVFYRWQSLALLRDVETAREIFREKFVQKKEMH